MGSYRVVWGDGLTERKKHGCCLYVADKIQFALLYINILIVAGVHFLEGNIYVILVNRLPLQEDADYELLVEFNQDFCIGREVLRTGDFISSLRLKWDKNDVLSRYVRPRDLAFYECFNELGVTQGVKEGPFID